MFPIAAFLAGPRRVPANPFELAPERSISAVSLNLAKEDDASTIVRAIHDAPRLRHADLFLLQEVVHQDGGSSVAEEAARRLGYFASFAPAAPGVRDQGLALMSRYPISEIRTRRLKACDLGFRNRTRFAMSATVQTPWGVMRVWNAHLDTRINAGERLDQLRPVIHEAARHRGPLIIGGDFNTNDLYWLRNVVPLPVGPSHVVALRGAMLRHGFQAPSPAPLNTYPALSRQLDWIFIRELRALETSVEPAAFSDHNAVWVRLGL